MLKQIQVETPVDALFVIPVGLSAFRHYAQRSAYVDFKLFSVAQPAQAALTRARMEEIAEPKPAHRSAQGWVAAQLWEENTKDYSAKPFNLEDLYEDDVFKGFLKTSVVLQNWMNTRRNDGIQQIENVIQRIEKELVK